MKLFVGLGNPGEKYSNHRHNVGFMVVDEIARRHGFSSWRKRFQAETADGTLDGEQVLLLKPQTYMNESGRAVGEAFRFFKLALSDVVVFHDELDLLPAKLRVKTGGGIAGHNGLRSISAHIGNDYQRVRIGIGHPGHKDRVSGYVLHDFAKTDHAWLEPMIDEIARAAGHLARGDAARFMTDVAQATRGDDGKAPGAKGQDGRAGARVGGAAGAGAGARDAKRAGEPDGSSAKAGKSAAPAEDGTAKGGRPSQRDLAMRAAQLRASGSGTRPAAAPPGSAKGRKRGDSALADRLKKWLSNRDGD